MDLIYSSTRNAKEKVTASQAILKGLADDGGLFVPDRIPSLDVTIDELGVSAVANDIHCMRHERLYTRQYMS